MDITVFCSYDFLGGNYGRSILHDILHEFLAMVQTQTKTYVHIFSKDVSMK